MTPVEYVIGRLVLVAVLLAPERAVAGALISSLACLTGERDAWRAAAAGVRCPMPQSVRRNKCSRPREAGVSGWLSFWAASPRAVERLGRAASWNLVAEESSSVRADACSRRVVGALTRYKNRG